ncbi:MAG: hypothetical protein ACI4F2_06690 [Acutalibacteraceae bacterium]
MSKGAGGDSRLRDSASLSRDGNRLRWKDAVRSAESENGVYLPETN